MIIAIGYARRIRSRLLPQVDICNFSINTEQLVLIKSADICFHLAGIFWEIADFNDSPDD